jgi:hypothetical protein
MLRRLLYVLQALLHAGAVTQRRVQVGRGIPQEEASQFPGIVFASLLVAADTAIMEKAIRGGLYQLSQQPAGQNRALQGRHLLGHGDEGDLKDVLLDQWGEKLAKGGIGTEPLDQVGEGPEGEKEADYPAAVSHPYSFS